MKQVTVPQRNVIVSNQKEFNSNTKRLTYIAVMVAISLIFKILGNVINFGAFKISFVYLPWIISAVMLGPYCGLAVGFIADILGQFIVPTGGSVLPLILLGNTLFPFIVGMVYRYLPVKNSYLKIIIGTSLSILICTLGLNSVGLYLAFYKTMPFLVYLVTYRLIQAAVIAVNLALVLALVPSFKKLKIFA